MLRRLTKRSAPTPTSPRLRSPWWPLGAQEEEVVQGTRDKLNNLVRCDKGTYDQLYKEVPTYNLITPSIVSWLKVRGSLARRALTELMGKGLIKQVVGYSSQMIYTRMIDDKEAEGGVEKESKGKKDKSGAKAQVKAEATAKTVEMSFNKMVTVCQPNAGYGHNYCKEVARRLSTTCLSSPLLSSPLMPSAPSPSRPV